MDTEDNRNALGEFLRARRELVRPEEVGLPGAGLRRVPGLRREEVAMLAGISADYYLRLERGRDRNPSIQVIEALAEVLKLDADSTAHVMELARPRPRRRRSVPRAERVPDGIAMLLDTLTVPAFVQNRCTDILAANRMAAAVSPHMAPGVNRLKALFTDPVARELHIDWEKGTAGVVAQLRAAAGGDTDDPRLAQLIGELSLKSERFRQLWARHDVRRGESATTRLMHPQVGELDLRREKLAIAGTDGLLLVVHHAEPGTPSADALAFLGSLSTTDSGTSSAPQNERPRG
ncbi:helix-turn-helix transcriptional regulator [Streptomyces sp. NPDC051987]|uniref:helix-turn-helix domain-containing protein n=1 Tax=Streptomyces sp. NPDC051987 TaxID=3155808 RepID=UPI00341A1995